MWIIQINRHLGPSYNMFEYKESAVGEGVSHYKATLIEYNY